MEILALGASVGLAYALMPNGKEPDLEQPDHDLETPYELFAHEFRDKGAIAPGHAAIRGRMPWDENFPPYYVAQQVPGGPNDHPFSRTHTALLNAYEHRRQEVAIEFAAHRDNVARKRSQPVWTAFTDELDLDGRSTNHVGFRWLPPDPTDSDWNEAALLARALPPNSNLYTPEGAYMTASGVPWRYGQGQTH